MSHHQSGWWRSFLLSPILVRHILPMDDLCSNTILQINPGTSPSNIGPWAPTVIDTVYISSGTFTNTLRLKNFIRTVIVILLTRVLPLISETSKNLLGYRASINHIRNPSVQ
ncbi:hypothetical protein KC19_VG042500 [Ceratodon purpureus]|uniref:Uncharacterized protein n=1 Tax=Ceratodon purpureus TaxID=3225 RepID=A0A8T0HMB3_CERPU|nr:hypothetical protein KC19_VG042500 [Ceratodon purpureus]